ncbi:MAG TPA: PilZ domain-containing protein [Candidatus Angelobacter sp.]|nr:PilZ domain-containing protein [Candidatus Angelobacter sp.]
MNVDVTVWGMDRFGKPFVQHARTLNATKSGARLLGIDCVREGETVGIQHGEQKSRFRVVWVGGLNTPRAGQVGVHCLEDKPIFTVARVTRGTEFDLGKITGYATALETARRARPEKKDAAPSRRKYQRYHCTGGVELRRPEGGNAVWANLSDLCLTGCYVETVSTFPSGSQLLFQLNFQDLMVRGRAVVKTSHHAVGMGLSFQHLTPADQQHLEYLLGSLAGSKETRQVVVKTLQPPTIEAPLRSLPVPTAPLPPMPVTVPPPPAQAPVMTATAPQTAQTTTPAATASPLPPTTTTQETTTPTSTTPVVAPQTRTEAGVFDQMMNALLELGELEQMLVRDKVDGRVMSQFHDALEHTRQTAWNVQRFVDLNCSGVDPFVVLPQLEAERTRMLMKLARNVTADIDSTGTDNFSHDVTGLYRTVENLQRRLTKMMASMKSKPTVN